MNYQEFENHLQKLSNQVRLRWPDLEIRLGRDYLEVGIPHVMNGSVRLEIPIPVNGKVQGHLVSKVEISGGTGRVPNDSLIKAQAHYNEMGRVLAALFFLSTHADGIEVCHGE